MSLEEDYFQKLESEAKARLKDKLEADLSRLELEEKKKLHYHMCGKCGSEMETKAFRGIEIEICPTCGAVLLDPGELHDLAGADQTSVFSSFFSMFGQSDD
jgi:rubrerythrin